MKSTISVILFCMIIQNVKPQQKVSFVTIPNDSQELLLSYSDSSRKSISEGTIYELELFPGQIFNGFLYTWSNSGLLECNYKEIPEVSWLKISQNHFTSTGCTDIIPIRFSFISPMNEGSYESILADSNGIWSDVKIILKVTKSPSRSTIMRFGMYYDSASFITSLINTPINFGSNNCIKDYFPRDSMQYNFQVLPAVNWLGISPLTGKIFKNEKQDFHFTIKKNSLDSTWITFTKDYYAYPYIYHYFIKKIEPKESSVYFNGTNGISAGYFPDGSTKTLMFWVMFDEVNTDQAIGVHDGENHRFYLGIKKDNTLFAGMGNSYTPTTSLNLISGKWYHMALTANADSAFVFINGTEVSRFPYSFSGESKASFMVGGRDDFQSTGGYVKGLIDEVQVWERPLNHQEIVQYMFYPPAGNENGLVIYYPFNEGWGDFTKNFVNNSYSGLLFNGPQWNDSLRRPNNGFFSGNEIIFGRWHDFFIGKGAKINGWITVPENKSDLIILLKKAAHIGYSDTWYGGIKLIRNGKVFKTIESKGDIDIHLKVPEAGRYDFELWSSNSGDGLIKFSTTIDSLSLGKWGTGEILRPYGSDWKQLDIPSGQEELYLETEGVGMWSTLDIYLDSLTNKTNHWQLKNWGQGYQISGTIKNPKPGRYYLKYTDSGVLVGSTSQIRDYLIIADAKPIIESTPLKPVITNLSTYVAGQGPITIEISGRGFKGDENPYLGSKKLSVIKPVSKVFDTLNSKWISYFNLSGVEKGDYYISLILNSSDTINFSRPVLVQEIKENEIKAEILIRNKVRLGRVNSLKIRIQNTGNINRYMIPIRIEVPRCNKIVKSPGKSWHFPNFSEIVPDWSDEYPIPDIEINPDEGTVEPFLENPQDISVIPLIINKLDANEIYEFEIPLSFNQYLQGNVIVHIGHPMIRTIEDLNNTSKGSGPNCMDSFLNLIYKTIIKTTFNIDAMDKCLGGFVSMMTDGFLAIVGNRTATEVFPSSYIWTRGLPTALNCLQAGLGTIPAFKIPLMLANIYNTVQNVKNFTQDCITYPEDESSTSTDVEVISSSTPEDKYGSNGYDSSTKATTRKSRFVNQDNAFTYRIDFWNKETATAPAQEVFIWDTLNVGLNDSTLNFTEVGFLRWKIKLEGGQYFNVNIDMRPDMNLIVNAEGTYDREIREIYYKFKSMDPATMELPEDPTAGFLPPVDTLGYNIAWVEFNVESYNELPTGTIIGNQAWVNFDGVGPTNPAPKAGQWINTIDNTLPESNVIDLPSVVITDSVLVSWIGTDAGSGIKNYNIFVSENNIDYTIWLNNTNSETKYFLGENGKTYYFYSIAKDNVGLVENPKSAYEAMVKFEISTGIDDIINKDNDNKILIFPNPTQSSFTVISEIKCTSKKIVEVFNSLGDKVLEQKFDKNEIIVNLHNHLKGIYFIKVTCGDITAYEKIVIY